MVCIRSVPHRGSQRKQSSRLLEGLLLSILRFATIFKPVVPLLKLRDAYSIVTESRLNLPYGFHLAVAQFLAKCDALALLQSRDLLVSIQLTQAAVLKLIFWHNKETF